MIETNSVYISKVDDDTVKVIIKQGACVSLKEYATFENYYYQLVGQKKAIKFLIIIEEDARIQIGIVNFYKGTYKTDFKKAEAYMIKNPKIKMFFTVGKKILNKRRDYPVKEFESEKEALSWLKSIS